MYLSSMISYCIDTVQDALPAFMGSRSVFFEEGRGKNGRFRHLGLRDRPLLQAQMDNGNGLSSIVCHLLYRTRLGILDLTKFSYHPERT